VGATGDVISFVLRTSYAGREGRQVERAREKVLE
jgi:hypothetical protein